MMKVCFLFSRAPEAIGFLLSLYLPYLSCVDSLSSGTLCPPVPGRAGCVCNHPDGIIDLTPISNSNGSARFTGLTDTNDYTYQFNPCNTFSVDTLCQDVFICQGTTWDSLVGYEIAKAGTEQIKIDANGTVYLHYTGPENREAQVVLICDTTEDGRAIVMTDGDTEQLFRYVFNLTSPYACPNPSLRAADSVVGTAGFSLILVILVAVVVYFSVGILVQRYKYKATGSDVIPNKRFWLGLPLLIKDGVVFTCCPCRKSSHCKLQTKQNYADEATDLLNESLLVQ